MSTIAINLPEKAAIPFRWLQQHYRIDELLREQDEMPEQISDIEREIANWEASARESRQRLTEIEAYTKAAVAAEMDEKGKPAFSSEDKRKTEATRRLSEDPEARQVQADIRRFEEAIVNARVDLDHLSRQWQALRRKLEVISAIILAISGR